MPRKLKPWCEGSSPLARGARTSTCPRFASPGIIPARAGSTFLARFVVQWGGDHPRSRGEHDDSVWTVIHSRGSSPLARGARMTLPPPWLPWGIIPARAGSTEGLVGKMVGKRDHPRSRGEHGERWIAKNCDVGSSPLARGAHRRAGRHGRSPGIIPARAGSTRIGERHRPQGRDHPRSRGEHRVAVQPLGCESGSSPLARGALGGCGCHPKSVTDHPRSRGEH